MNKPIIVILPLPPRELSPNSRSHYMAKSRATKKCRVDAGLSTRASMNARPQNYPWPLAILEPHFFFTCRRTRDSDNLSACLKACRDGIADAGLVANDCNIRNAEPVVEIDRHNPRVELHLTKLDA